MLFRKTLLGLCLLLPAMALQAHDYQSGQLHIDHPWTREMPAVAPTSAAYFIIRNSGGADDRLLGATTPVADKAELHEHVHSGDMMKMQQIQSVVIPAGGEARFEPMGYHVMLFGLQRQAQAGERFPLTLNFEKAGEVLVEVVVHKDAPVQRQDAPSHENSSGHHTH